MYKNIAKTLFVLLLVLKVSACGNRQNKAVEPTEDLTAKHDLQGIWLDEDGEDVAFRVKGDSIYFPDSTSGYIVKLYNTNDASYMDAFVPKAVQNINQKKVVKRDSVVFFNDEKYHCYIQINPTTYKVVKPSVNDDGVEVDNVYYDNIVNLTVFNGNKRLFSADMRKEAFVNEVPEQFLKQAVYSDLYFDRIDAEGLHFFSVLAMPETSISYMVESIVEFNGKLIKRIKK